MRFLGAVCRLSSSAVSDAEALSTISSVFNHDGKSCGYVLDPHTAVGVHAAITAAQTDLATIRVCMGCAHPSKFSGAIERAIGSFSPRSESKNYDKWWWLSSQDRAHRSVINLLALEGRVPVAEDYEIGTNWTARLKQHIQLSVRQHFLREDN